MPDVLPPSEATVEAAETEALPGEVETCVAVQEVERMAEDHDEEVHHGSLEEEVLDWQNVLVEVLFLPLEDLLDPCCPYLSLPCSVVTVEDHHPWEHPLEVGGILDVPMSCVEFLCASKTCYLWLHLFRMSIRRAVGVQSLRVHWLL